MAAGFDNFRNYLNLWGAEVVRTAKANLRDGGRGGGDLEKSIKAEVIDTGDGFDVKFSMKDYGGFMDKGVKGEGGTIKTGAQAGSYGGRRWFIDYRGKRKDSPFQFGSGKSSGSISKGIEKYIRKKGIKPDKGTVEGLKFAMVKVLWTKGIHGISFFQNSLMLGLRSFPEEMGEEIKEDIIDTMVTFEGISRA